jgi:hypothetical protein
MSKAGGGYFTVMRKSDETPWTTVEIAKVMMGFNATVGVNQENPEDIALVGHVSERAVEEFKLAHEEFKDLLVMHDVPISVL